LEVVALAKPSFLRKLGIKKSLTNVVSSQRLDCHVSINGQSASQPRPAKQVGQRIEHVLYLHELPFHRPIFSSLIGFRLKRTVSILVGKKQVSFSFIFSSIFLLFPLS
jgi:hypothetical protein